jgi:hypothetical protein
MIDILTKAKLLRLSWMLCDHGLPKFFAVPPFDSMESVGDLVHNAKAFRPEMRRSSSGTELK